MHLFPFANYFLALYSQATMPLTWERIEELSDNSVEQVCPGHAHTSWWEQLAEISRIFKPKWLNRTVTKTKLCKLTIKYIILKPKVTNTENSSLPNYFTTFLPCLCSWGYLHILNQYDSILYKILYSTAVLFISSQHHIQQLMSTAANQPGRECLHHGHWQRLQIRAWFIAMLIV